MAKTRVMGSCENLILHEEPLLTVHMSLTKLKMKFISCYTVTVLQIIIRQQFINDIKLKYANFDSLNEQDKIICQYNVDTYSCEKFRLFCI